MVGRHGVRVVGRNGVAESTSALEWNLRRRQRPTGIAAATTQSRPAALAA